MAMKKAYHNILVAGPAMRHGTTGILNCAGIYFPEWAGQHRVKLVPNSIGDLE